MDDTSLFPEKTQYYLVIANLITFAATVAVFIHFIKADGAAYRVFYLLTALVWFCACGDYLLLLKFEGRLAFISLFILLAASIVFDVLFLKTWLITAFAVISAAAAIVFIKDSWIIMDWI